MEIIMDEKKQVNVFLEQETFEKLEAMREQDRRSKTEMVAWLIEKEFRHRERLEARKAVAA